MDGIEKVYKAIFIFVVYNLTRGNNSVDCGQTFNASCPLLLKRYPKYLFNNNFQFTHFGIIKPSLNYIGINSWPSGNKSFKQLNPAREIDTSNLVVNDLLNHIGIESTFSTSFGGSEIILLKDFRSSE